MKSPVVVIGIGEMGSVFARGFLRAGYPVHPVTRQSDLAETARRLPSPGLVLVAVAESDLHAVLENLPTGLVPAHRPATERVAAERLAAIRFSHNPR